MNRVPIPMILRIILIYRLQNYNFFAKKTTCGTKMQRSIYFLISEKAKNWDFHVLIRKLFVILQMQSERKADILVKI